MSKFIEGDMVSADGEVGIVGNTFIDEAGKEKADVFFFESGDKTVFEFQLELIMHGQRVVA